MTRTAVVLLLLLAAPADAQVTPSELATGATSGLLQQGVLGLFCILEFVGIWVLYRQTLTQNAKFVEMAVQVSAVLAENNSVLRRNEELLEKALDRAALPRAREREREREGTEVVGIYRGARP